jgi:hypothetical protein
MAEAGIASELILGNAFDELEQPVVNVLLVPEHLEQRKSLLLLGRQGVEGVDPAVGHRISRWPFAHENARQMFQRLLFPGGDVSNDVSH